MSAVKRMSSERNFSGNSICVSESFKNDETFLKDVPELVASELIDAEVPHFYVTLPALGPLWCS